jgi:hypothetical protein
MGAVESLGALCLAVGLPLGGALVALSSTRVAFLVIGVGTAVTTVAFVRLRSIGLEAATPDGLFADTDGPERDDAPVALTREPAAD